MKFTYVLTLFLLSVFFISGCEGIDISQVSDEDLERLSEKTIVCPENYIRFGTSCCIDQNDNNICDRDERSLSSTYENEPKQEVPEDIIEETIDEEFTSYDIGYTETNGFKPSTLRINVGTEVRWFNEGQKAMVLIIFKNDTSYFNSPVLNPEEGIKHEFTEAGEYEYWRDISHGPLSGKIIVLNGKEPNEETSSESIKLVIDIIYTEKVDEDLGYITKVDFTIENNGDDVLSPVVDVYAYDNELDESWQTKSRGKYYGDPIEPSDQQSGSIEISPRSFRNLDLEKNIRLTLEDTEDGFITAVNEEIFIS